MHITLRRTAAAATLALGLTSLAACGGNDEAAPKASDQANPSASSSASASTGSTGSSSADGAGDQVSTADFIDTYSEALEKATTAHISMKFSRGKIPLDVTGVADFSSAPPDVQLDLNDPTTKTKQTVVIADGASYVPVPGVKGKFLKTDLKDSPFGTGGTDFLDPTSMIKVLKEGITAATRQAGEDVDGETLDHYTLQVDSKAVLAASGQDLSDLPAGAVPDSIAYDIYFDGDGLLRKVSADLGSAAGTVEISFDQWGDPVDITVPDPSQVQSTPGG